MPSELELGSPPAGSTPYTTTYCPEKHESISICLLDAIAGLWDVEMTNLPPLYPIVDMEALEHLVAHDTQTRVHIGFVYGPVTVTVDSENHITIESTNPSE